MDTNPQCLVLELSDFIEDNGWKSHLSPFEAEEAIQKIGEPHGTVIRAFAEHGNLTLGDAVLFFVLGTVAGGRFPAGYNPETDTEKMAGFHDIIRAGARRVLGRDLEPVSVN